MSDQDEFFRQVRDALSHLFDYPYLENHPLARRYWPNSEEVGPNRAQQLNRLLLEHIEELNPPEALPKDSFRSRAYFLLVYRYVDEWSLPDIMNEFGLSRRQFFREQRKALEMLVALLREKAPKQATVPVEGDNVLAAEAERFLTRRRAVSLSEVVQGVLETVSPLAAQHNVEMVPNLGLQFPLVYGSRTLLRQMFLKTLTSLITQPNTRRINLQLRDKKDRIIAEVITEAGQAEAQPQSHVNNWQRDLESVRRLIEMLDGLQLEFEIKSEGPVLIFDFPTHREAAILVVDDNEAVIAAFQRYLADYNYQVIGATVGSEALRLARETDPAAITLDIMIPTQDGWEILQALKSDPVTQHIPVIICSALADPDLARSLGAFAFLRKPISQVGLLEVLDNLPSG